MDKIIFTEETDILESPLKSNQKEYKREQYEAWMLIPNHEDEFGIQEDTHIQPEDEAPHKSFLTGKAYDIFLRVSAVILLSVSLYIILYTLL